MNVFVAMVKPVAQLALGFLLLQGFGPPPQEGFEDPFARATTPPTQFLVFNEDFSSLDPGRLLGWIHPNRGLVKNGVLLTKEESEEVFYSEPQAMESGSLVELNLHFNYGIFAGGNTYQADCWVEYKIREEGGERWLRFHNLFVFEIIDLHWYWVQSEYVAPEAGVVIDFESPIGQSEELDPAYERFVVPYSDPGLAGVINWPLLLGSNFETELQPLEGKTMGGGTWSLADSVAEGKPVVLYFFSVHGFSVALGEDFEAQMEFLSGLYETFGHDDLFIFGATDDVKEDVEWLGESGYNQFAPLLDEGSNLHATLNIDVHPYIVVFDGAGTVVGVSKTFHPSSFSLIEERVREALARAGAGR